MNQRKSIEIITIAAAAAALILFPDLSKEFDTESERQSRTEEISYSVLVENRGSASATLNISNTQSKDGASEWTETPISGVLYVNTDKIYSRIYAIQGSTTVKQYSLDDKVTVTAKTDTDYYKLNDGTFLHSDYLSNAPENAAYQWTETPVSGELYVNTDKIYSRIYAIQGSTTVKQYRLNDKVTVTAKTNTDYYKLNDGTFIHCDYLSNASKNSANQWTETPVSGEFYVNTDKIYSRIYAIQGSTTIKQYRLNNKVTVTAKTNTDYYKLNDGTFIHCDYLSKNKIAVNDGNLADYTSLTPNGYTIERKDGITYVDGIMVANKTYTLPMNYDPGIMPEAYSAFTQMQNAAAQDGISLFIVSGYRSYSDQDAIYARYVYNDGRENADTYSSRPGHSDHQTGYTFDLNSLAQSFANTAEGKWLAEHCADYGFIIRYPEGKEAYTGYMFEPWHVRYIGKEKAKAITASGLSFEEYYCITSDYADCKY